MALQTDRCELRMLDPNDFGLFTALNANSEVRHFLGGTRDLNSIERDFAALMADGTTTAYVATVLETQNSFALVLFGPHHDGAAIEVSYLLLPEYWGQGLAAEIITAAITAYFELHPKLNRIVAETQAANLRSCALLSRMGMMPIRKLVRFGADQIIYAKSRV